VTRGEQYLKGGDLVLLDTPGLLWPKASRLNVLHLLGAVEGGEEEREEAARFLLEHLASVSPERLAQRYGWPGQGETVDEMLAAVGQSRGCLLPGGRVDLHRAADLVLEDFRAGKLGPVSLEKPPEEGSPAEGPLNGWPPEGQPRGPEAAG
jgi:ribosome biogenesis GTPase A